MRKIIFELDNKVLLYNDNEIWVNVTGYTRAAVRSQLLFSTDQYSTMHAISRKIYLSL